MKTENVVQTKSYAFAVRIVRLYQHLVNEKKEFVLSKQVLRCGTSIGANVEEAIAGISKKDFTAKMSISSKEARETKYWLRLIDKSNIVQIDVSKPLLEIESIINILTKIVKTSQEN